MPTRTILISLALSVVAAATISTAAAAGSTGGNGYLPAYTTDGRLVPPTDYYHWVFLTSDLGMSYNETDSSSDHPPFSNVFVNRSAYRAFLATGTWPDKTEIVKEFRRSVTEGSINRHGYYQAGKALGMLVHVKDKKRFKGGWAFFAFPGDATAKPSMQIPTSADCYSCHEAHGAVDTTFVQFYPTLLPIARKHATLSAGYLKEEAQPAKSPKSR